MNEGKDVEETLASTKRSFEEEQLEIAKQQLEINRESLKAAQTQAEAAQTQAEAGKSGVRLAWFATLAAFLAAIAALWPLLRAVKGVESAAQDVRSIEKAILSSKFVISSMSSGDQVTINEVISGFTPYPNRNHYLVITPLRVGDSYVQDLATVRADGTWTGSAKFGSGEVGLNEKFTVRCLATEAELKTGSLASQPLPPDAVFSSPIIVTRTH